MRCAAAMPLAVLCSGTLLLLLACAGVSAIREDLLEAAVRRPRHATSEPAILGRARASPLELVGFAESCLEFGAQHLPGTLFKDYAVPANSSIDFLHKAGANLFRVPFLWERVQPTAKGPLNTSYLHLIDQVVEHVTEDVGAAVLLDVHNYARYYGNVIGESNVTIDMFADLWSRLASHYGEAETGEEEPRAKGEIIFGLCNEPHGMKTETIVAYSNAAIKAIRATGSANRLTVAGNGYSGAHSWNSSSYGTPNSIAMLNVVDSLPGKMIFEPHQYLDSDSSGSHTECVSPTVGVERVQGMTDWLRKNKRVALLGEFAGAHNDECHEAVANLLDFLEANRDVWVGWSWWAAGPWWGSYMYSMEPHIPDMLPWVTPYMP